MSGQTIALQKALVESLWRELLIARDMATKVRQETVIVEERLNLLIRQLIHAGAVPDVEFDGVDRPK